MEQILRSIYQERASDPSTIGVILVEKRKTGDPITDTFDAVLLIITSEATPAIYSKHYSSEDGEAAMHVISEEKLMKWLLVGTKRKVVDWIYYGKILFDRNEYVETLKKDLHSYPIASRKIKMGIELSKLVRAYMEGKNFFEQEQYMDAYTHVVNSLRYLARLSIIEKGLFPEVTLWSQIKRIDPSIYKLYEELIISEETLSKRLELLFLASEFYLHNRTADGAQHILEVMEQQDKWEIQELHEHPELMYYSIELEVFIEYLVDKGYITPIQSESKNEIVSHRYYKKS